jgi:transposase InsO family protein
VSRVTVYKWESRYAALGLDGLRDQSRAPHYQANATSEVMVERILRARDAWEWGAVKIRDWLVDTVNCESIPAASTIGEILKEHGRTTTAPKRRRAPQRTEPLVHCDGPNRVWCADFKGWFLTGDGQRCDPLTITDGFSRYLLCCQIVPQTTHEAVEPVFDTIFRTYGLPDIIRTDNGVPFAAPNGLGLSKLAIKWIKCGITPERIRPGKPQENGRHERMHRTLKERTLNPPASTRRRQQQRFNVFCEHYNHERPHESANRLPPGRSYTPSLRPYPARIPTPEYPSDWYVQRVYDKGSFRWNDRLLHLSSTLQDEYVAVASSPLDRYLEIYFGHVRIAYIDTKHKRVLMKLPKPALECIKQKEH